MCTTKEFNSLDQAACMLEQLELETQEVCQQLAKNAKALTATDKKPVDNNYKKIPSPIILQPVKIPALWALFFIEGNN